jgi:hypothetical protein
MLPPACNLFVQVKDQTGAVVPNASVSIAMNGQNVAHGSTDAEGHYRLSFREGAYTLSIASFGFVPVARSIAFGHCPDVSMERISIVLDAEMIGDPVVVSVDFSVPLESAPVPTTLHFELPKEYRFTRLARKLKSLLVR